MRRREIHLRDQLADWLRHGGWNVRAEVPCAAGRVDLFVELPDRGSVVVEVKRELRNVCEWAQAAGQAMAYRAATGADRAAVAAGDGDWSAEGATAEQLAICAALDVEPWTLFVVVNELDEVYFNALPCRADP